MPVINIDIPDLTSLLGREYPMDELLAGIPMIGADAGIPAGDTLPVEFFPDRPDMFSVEGAARALRYFLCSPEELEGMELPNYTVTPSGITMTVDASVGDVRPFVVGTVIRNVEMSDPLIQSLMDHQEKLHLSIGRKRMKAAIGVHDLSNVTGPFRYTTADPDHSFIPLMRNSEMTLRDILDHHEKGIAYKHILEGREHYPIITDRDQQVLSFPPIINGELTVVREDTTDIFIEVTGMELRPITLALNILATAFAERGASIESIEITYDTTHPQFGGNTIVVPDLTWKEIVISVDGMNRLLNTSLTAGGWVLPLKRMGLEAEIPTGTASDEMMVRYPAYRADILHEWDIYEDAAIGFGYDNIAQMTPRDQSTGKSLPIIPFIRKFQRTMVGLGYAEVKSLTLVGEKEGFENMGLPLPESATIIRNPITDDHTRLRSSLLPLLLSILRANRHRDLPQRIFEPGIVVEEGRNTWKGAGLAIHSKAGFTEMKSTILSLLPAFGKDPGIRVGDHPSFVPGRCADILVEGKCIGQFGELHPEVISAFELEYPVIAFELSLEDLQ